MNRTKNLLRRYSPFTTGDSLLASAVEVRPNAHAPSPARLSRLSHAIIAKSLVEAVFVVALAVYFSYTNFNPHFRGSVDSADERAIAGWVVDESSPAKRVEVYLYVDGHFVGRGVADAPRPDVLEAGRSLDANHGFVFNLPPLPPGRTYEARVYAVHESADAMRRSLQQIGAARQFGVTADSAKPPVSDTWWESEGRR